MANKNLKVTIALFVEGKLYDRIEHCTVNSDDELIAMYDQVNDRLCHHTLEKLENFDKAAVEYPRVYPKVI